MSDNLSRYPGDMLAILLAVQWVEDTRPLRAIVCSDSSSSLDSLKYNNSDSRPDILLEVQQTLYRIKMMGLTIIFYGYQHILESEESRWQIRWQRRPQKIAALIW